MINAGRSSTRPWHVQTQLVNPIRFAGDVDVVRFTDSLNRFLIAAEHPERAISSMTPTLPRVGAAVGVCLAKTYVADAALCSATAQPTIE